MPKQPSTSAAKPVAAKPVSSKKAASSKPQSAPKKAASSKKTVILAYSGGLDTSVIAKWLDLQGYDVVCLAVDVGQKDDFGALEAKALASGAREFVLADAKEEFVRDYVFPAVMWNARYEGRYLLGTSLARPIIAKHLVEAAKARGANAISHGATGKGNDQVRFELTAAALMPGVEVIAPWRLREFFTVIKGREEAIDFAREHNIPVKATAKKPWSSDENLLHISYEAGILEDPSARAPEEIFEWTTNPRKAPDTPGEIEIGFEQGVPVSLDGKRLGPVELLEKLNAFGCKHGVGRIDMVESRHVGMKSRGVYETPGGTLLQIAHRDVEALTLDRGEIQLKETLMPRWAQLAYYGYWHCREMECLAALLAESQRFCTGFSRVEAYKGNAMAISRRSEYSLYDEKVASMNDDAGAFDPTRSTGFIAISALPLEADARRRARVASAKSGKGAKR